MYGFNGFDYVNPKTQRGELYNIVVIWHLKEKTVFFE